MTIILQFRDSSRGRKVGLGLWWVIVRGWWLGVGVSVCVRVRSSPRIILSGYIHVISKGKNSFSCRASTIPVFFYPKFFLSSDLGIRFGLGLE